jgi:orotate phosphoribosyltransferase
MEEQKKRLLEVLREKSLKIGNFTLVSGMKSHYYFDSKPTTLDPEGGYLTARMILQLLKEKGIKAESIGGLTLGADPIVSAVAAVSFIEKDEFTPLPAYIVRKEAKKHGTQKFIEGYDGGFGTKVVVIDDVCTTGGSTVKAINLSKDAGYEVAAVVCLVDREQGGAEALKDYQFFSLFTATELLDDPAIQAEIKALG